jgi:hypothetical protein
MFATPSRISNHEAADNSGEAGICKKSYAESCSSALAASEIHLVRNVYLWILERPRSYGTKRYLF